MKKYLSFFAVLAMLLLVGAPAVSAVDGESDAVENKKKGEEVRKEWQNTREALKKGIEVRKEEAKKKIEALREGLKTEKDALVKKVKEARISGREKALERFDAAVTKMTALKDRVSAQVTKLEAKEIDTEEAGASLVIAETKLSEAKSKIADATALLGVSLDQLTAEEKTKLRTLAQEIQSLLKETRTSLGDAIKSLKEAVKTKIEAAKQERKDDSDKEDSAEETVQ
ncbi:MAG: hypothetical protein M3M85_03380 [bacterium]|nr:hypothetical protein [bacterium]